MEISAGGDIPKWMEESLEKADHCLLYWQDLPDEAILELGAPRRPMGCHFE
jgi:hypothetical protein